MSLLLAAGVFLCCNIRTWTRSSSRAIMCPPASLLRSIDLIRYRNFNLLSIAYASRLGLGPDYPESTIVAQEPSGFRWKGFSPFFSILIPAFSLLIRPHVLPVMLLPYKNAPLPMILLSCHSFGSVLEPRTFSAQRLSTSELLRTL